MRQSAADGHGSGGRGRLRGTEWQRVDLAGVADAHAGTGQTAVPGSAGSDPVPAGKLDAAALPKQFPREVYTANGGTILVVRAEEGGCQHALGEAVEQTPQHVVVNLSETKAETGKMCTMDLRHPVISVALAAPLGERTVVLKKSPPR